LTIDDRIDASRDDAQIDCEVEAEALADRLAEKWTLSFCDKAARERTALFEYARRSADREGLAASAIGDEAKAREAEAHHRPGRGLRSGAARRRNARQRNAVEERNGGRLAGPPSERNTSISEADVAVKFMDPVSQPVKPFDGTSSVAVSWVSPPSETWNSLVVAPVQQPVQPNEEPLTNSYWVAAQSKVRR
jgi:hypothetical protein